ncbi:MAG TPA: carboxypeptidase regulatory-like domain-containing protein [Thermoplasmata archaeon]|nr:carboxypeptidase regulatory-like domain-containing protein [Thermoplasmata archaeon]
MQSTNHEWWRRHGWTVAILLGAFAMAFAIRTIWTYPIIQQFGALYSYGGGSDSYYHSRVTTYIIQNHQNLVFDPLLHYPIGAYNPREPLFDWMNAILGIVFAPFFGGNAVTAGAWFLDFQAPFWAALGVFPVYLIGKEVSGRRMGLIAALIFPFLSANIDSSIFGYANYLSFYTFFILIAVYSYLRTIKAVGSRRWVESYAKPRQFLPALRAFYRHERTAVKWAVFTGVSLGALALAWQGYTYAVVVIGVTVLVAMIIERIRRVDSFGLYVVTWIIGLVGFPMAMPYYIVQHQFSAWFDLPLLLYFGVLLLLLPFLLLRDIPWIFSIPVLVFEVVLAAIFLYFVTPTYFSDIVTGQGYFSKTLIYSTVAEAQAPSIDALVVGYGVVTFFLAFVGVAIFLFITAKGRFKRYHLAFLVFAILSIYLPISAAKFFLIGSPAFALLAAEPIRRILDVGGYPELRRKVVSLSDSRSQASAFRKAFKPRHVLVMALVLLIILPNVWVSIDAGIPGNTKTQFSQQVFDSLPSWLKGNSSTSSNYFGAAGSSIDTSNQYDSAGYNWLATQDTNTPIAQRPALVSWWDYGFQTIDQGQHPSVADNFQNGIDPAGQFLLSQNESSAIAILITTLLQAEQRATGSPYLTSGLATILRSNNINVTQVNQLMANESGDVALVVNNPGRYLPVNPATLTVDNAMYLATSYLLATSTTLTGISTLYNEVQAYTGWSVRYDLTDSRLIPFSGQNTGIFYAPADLTGRVINDAGLPTTFFNVTVLGSDGNYYPLGQVPADVTPVNYYVNYFAPFYNSMIYRTYFGYNGTDVGLGNGIPGLEGDAGADPVMPGWMLQHFEVVYKTAYYCDQTNVSYSQNAGCYVAMNQPQAVSLAAAGKGTANTSAGLYFSGGESMLAYYPGETLLGDVQLPNGAGIGGARVTVFDQWGIPHMSVTTAPDGSFSIVLPPGNDTLNITSGALQGLTQQGATLLKEVNISVPDALGFSLQAPTTQMTFTLQPSSAFGFVYYNAANSTAYIPGRDPLVSGAQVVLWGADNVSKYTATTDGSGTFQIANLPPGYYNYNVLYGGYNYSQPQLNVLPSPSPPTNATTGLPPGSVSGSVFNATGAPQSGATVTFLGPSGVVRTNQTNATGVYKISGFAPGNYTLSAALAGTDYRSAGVRIPYLSPPGNWSQNLTLEPTARVSVTVSANGAPAVNIPVQFTPIPSYANLTQSPISDLLAATGNGTSVLTTANGAASLYLPLGNYSVTAVGFVGSTLYAGIGEIASSSLQTGTLSLGLQTAIRLTGSVASVAGVVNGSRTAVVAYAADGSPSFTWAVNGSYSFLLPAGSYSLLALEGPTSSATSIFAALGSVALSYPTAVNLQPSAAIAVRFSIGAVLASNAIYPAVGARVMIAAGSNGPTVTTIANANGSVIAYLPSSLPLPATGYCLAAGATGYASASMCNIAPNSLAAMTRLPLSLVNVPTTVSVTGVPGGPSITLNLTALSPTAVNRTLTGGAVWSTSLPPGVYGVSGYAPTGSGNVLYRPLGPENVTLAFGAVSGSIALALVSQVRSTGALTVPAGAVLSNSTVTLSSSSFHTTVNGTAYSSAGFFAPPGTYSAYGTTAVGGAPYTALQIVSISSTGAISPGLSLTTPGLNLSGTLVKPGGATLAVNTTVTLTSPGGAAALVPVRDGTFGATLPGATTYAAAVAATVLVQGASGPYYTSWVSAPGASCAVASTSTSCPISMVGTDQLVWLNGTLAAPGVPGYVAGTVRLYGPSSGPGTTTVSATNGTFAVQLLPGQYSLYASGGGGSEPFAAFASVSISLDTPSTLPLVLSSTWAVTLSVAAPSGVALAAPANVTISNAFGYQAVYTNVAPGSPFVVALPIGSYTVTAASFGTPAGLLARASATANITVVRGNVGSTLALTYAYTYRVAATVLGADQATVTSPGSTTFSYSVRNTGNIPVTIHPVGSPAYWGFNFSFANATLAPTGIGSSLSGEVEVYIPVSTPVSHPSVVIAFELANGTSIGNFTPTVNVVAYYGLGVGPTSSATQVGVSHVLVPFYVSNTGNIGESILLTIPDSSQIAALGWTSSLRSLSAPLTSPYVSVGAFTNATYFVNLTAVGAVFVPVGSVQVDGSVANVSGSIAATTVLPVPTASVRPGTTNGSAPVTVTGPAVGPPPSNLPDWVVPLLSFVPALALVIGVITYRWWRTRRWTRR